MSGGHFDYVEHGIKRLAEDYEEFNNIPNEDKYGEIKHIPEWVIELMKEVYEITHDIDWDISGDSSIEEGYFEGKRKKIRKITLPE